MDKDSIGQRQLEASGGVLLPAVGGHSLEQNRIEQNRNSKDKWRNQQQEEKE